MRHFLLFQKPPQYLLGDLLGLTARLPRGSHARRAALLAGADVDRLQAVLEEVLFQFEQRRDAMKQIRQAGYPETSHSSNGEHKLFVPPWY